MLLLVVWIWVTVPLVPLVNPSETLILVVSFTLAPVATVRVVGRPPVVPNIYTKRFSTKHLHKTIEYQTFTQNTLPQAWSILNCCCNSTQESYHWNIFHPAKAGQLAFWNVKLKVPGPISQKNRYYMIYMHRHPRNSYCVNLIMVSTENYIFSG